jgi:hypothetical protein
MSMAEQRAGDWIQTFGGKQFWPVDPRPEDIDIGDIAHALSMLCRYGGHCQRFYSVAEHCVLLAGVVESQHKLWALLHDASEAYLVDVPRPIKPYLIGYGAAEDAIMTAVAVKFDLGPMPPEVKAADRAILTDERSQNMSAAPEPWSTDGAPLGVSLQFWGPARAKQEFMAAFEALSSPIPHTPA